MEMAVRYCLDHVAGSYSAVTATWGIFYSQITARGASCQTHLRGKGHWWAHAVAVKAPLQKRHLSLPLTFLWPNQGHRKAW